MLREFFLSLRCVFHGIRLLRLIMNLIYREISIIRTPCAVQHFVVRMVQKKGACEGSLFPSVSAVCQ